MSMLKEKLAQTIPQQAEKIKAFVKENGDKVVSDVTIKQAFGGMRGVKGLVCDTSVVPPDKGLIIRGHMLKDIAEKLPEEILWLLLTGELPNDVELKDLQNDLASRYDVPQYVWDIIDAMPADQHPMTMLNAAILSMQGESVFAVKYAEGLPKSKFWEETLEDLLNILAKIPSIAAYVYRKRFDKGPRIEPDKSLDWAANYAHMLGVDDPNGEFKQLMRLYMVLHSDHEGGNASAFTSSIISSTLADLYYTISGGLNALAGPLHGLANQNCLQWVLELMEKFGGKTPTAEELEKFTWDTLNSGQVVPGYGHAVLRVTDPRYDAFHKFGEEHMSDDPVFATVSQLYKVVPEVLKQIEKISNPWPNVDAGSGALLYHYGLREFSYYTVLFSVSRAMGMGAQAVIARGYGFPITRPKSLMTEKYMELAK